MSDLDVVEYRLRSNYLWAFPLAWALMSVGIWAPLPTALDKALLLVSGALILWTVWRAFRPARPTGPPLSQ